MVLMDTYNLEIWTVCECFCLELISTSLHQLSVMPVASFGWERLDAVEVDSSAAGQPCRVTAVMSTCRE